MTVMLLFFPPLWDMHFNQIGKNDIAMSAFIMAALYFLLQYITDTSTNKAFRQNILLTRYCDRHNFGYQTSRRIIFRLFCWDAAQRELLQESSLVFSGYRMFMYSGFSSILVS